MADFTVPATWTFDGDTKDQSVFRVDGHTATENYIVVFDRKQLSSNGNGFTRPSYRVRVIRSFTNDDGEPVEGKAVVDCNMSWPAAAPAASVKAMLGTLEDFLSDTETQSDVVDDLDIPRG